MPTLDRITIFPVKSLDGVEVAAARVLSSGALEHDRRWQLVDMEGRVVNARHEHAPSREGGGPGGPWLR